VNRGFSVIALDRPKNLANLGGCLRAATCYEADLIVLAGQRFQRSITDTTKAWRHIPVVETAEVFDAIPYSCVPVAVDLLPDATPLPDFEHPERAFYIFGAEDATLGARVVSRCKHKLMVPTAFCMNLAATVNVILYDRMAKRRGARREIA
jgi:tRNA(Leu) C34 or U34 (ribose-2'-O)-methylase TrmL